MRLLKQQQLPTTTITTIITIIIIASLLLFVNGQNNKQDTIIGIVGKDFVMIGADTTISSSIALTTSDYDKISILVDPFPNNDSSLSSSSSSSSSSLSSSSSSSSDDDAIINRQQTIVVASAGNTADSNKLINLLKAHCTIREYEEGLGCDVSYVDLLLSEFEEGKDDIDIDTDDNNKNNKNNNNNNNKIIDLEKIKKYIYSPPGLTVSNVAHLARQKISSSLRTPQRLDTCLLVGGMEPVLVSSSSSSSSIDDNDDNDNDDNIDHFSKRIQRQVLQAWPSSSSSSKEQISDDNEKKEEGDLIIKHQQQSEKKTSPRLLIRRLEPKLYWLDEYGSKQKVQYGSHGFGSNFILSILDRSYKNNLSKDEALCIIKKCFQQLQSRYVINLSPNPPCIKYIDAYGCTTI